MTTLTIAYVNVMHGWKGQVQIMHRAVKTKSNRRMFSTYMNTANEKFASDRAVALYDVV